MGGQAHSKILEKPLASGTNHLKSALQTTAIFTANYFVFTITTRFKLFTWDILHLTGLLKINVLP